MIDWRDLLRCFLDSPKYMLSADRAEQLFDGLEEFIEDHFDPDGRAEFSVMEEGEEALSAEEEATEIFGPSGGER